MKSYNVEHPLQVDGHRVPVALVQFLQILQMLNVKSYRVKHRMADGVAQLHIVCNSLV